MSEVSYFLSFLAAAIPAGMPLLYGTLGEILTEKGGNLNLGVEGMMYMGAIFGFVGGYYAGSVLLMLLLAFAGGALGALIYAVLTVTLKANQNVTGLTLTIFGTGLANFIGENIVLNSPSDGSVSGRIPPTSRWEIPVLGPMLFDTNILCVSGHRHRGGHGPVSESHARGAQPAGHWRKSRGGRRGGRERYPL